MVQVSGWVAVTKESMEPNGVNLMYQVVISELLSYGYDQRAGDLFQVPF